MSTLRMEWRYTYHSARRDGDSRWRAARKFVREVLKGYELSLGFHPKYDRKGHSRG